MEATATEKERTIGVKSLMPIAVMPFRGFGGSLFSAPCSAQKILDILRREYCKSE